VQFEKDACAEIYADLSAAQAEAQFLLAPRPAVAAGKKGSDLFAVSLFERLGPRHACIQSIIKSDTFLTRPSLRRQALA
jgi:hypothetical protein